MDLATISATAQTLTNPNLRPRNAATLMIVDRSGPEPKVLMGKRHVSHAFMPGHYVFPGGRIEIADRHVPVIGALHASVESRLLRDVVRPNSKTARAFALAAIRETFEETGIVIGRKPAGKLPVANAPWAGFFATGFLPDLSGLRFIARARTPPRARRRFDARFLAVDAGAIAYQAAGVVHAGTELTELVWVGLQEAMKLPLPDITELVLVDLAARIAAGFVEDAPVPFYRMHGRRFGRTLI
jgi:8-oxo-dGTP pyrophosphatase MutT (NUDIX family)